MLVQPYESKALSKASYSIDLDKKAASKARYSFDSEKSFSRANFIKKCAAKFSASKAYYANSHQKVYFCDTVLATIGNDMDQYCSFNRPVSYL